MGGGEVNRELLVLFLKSGYLRASGSRCERARGRQLTSFSSRRHCSRLSASGLPSPLSGRRLPLSLRSTARGPSPSSTPPKT